MLQQTSGVSSPHQNKENRFMWIYVRKHLAFEVQPNSVLTSVLQIFMCGVTKKPLVYSVPIENEETLHKHVFDTCQTIGNRSATFQSGRWSMVRRMTQMEEIFSVCWKLWLDKQYELHSY